MAKSMKRIFALLILVLSFTHQLFAQENVALSGIVNDAEGNPIVGAVAVFTGKDGLGAVTGADGRWSLTVPVLKDSYIIITCLGYSEERIKLGTQSVFETIMREDSEMLEETVVVGYGAMKRSDLTGALTSVDVDEAASSRSMSMDRLIQGRAAGVQVLSNNAAPDAGVSMRIRGMSSFNGSNEPLYVVDGVIINGRSDAVSLFDTSAKEEKGSDEATNGLMGINPRDIDNIEILKDASATAIYGSQGANGVVLITTRQASKEQPVVTASIGFDVGTRNKKMDVLSKDEYLSYLGDLNEVAPGILSDNTYQSLKERIETAEAMDWQDYSMRTSFSQRYYLSVAGKPKMTSYLFSVGYNLNQGIIKGTDVEQYTARLNLSRNLFKNFKIGVNANISYVSSNLTQGATTGSHAAGSSMMRSILMTRPYTTVLDDDDDAVDDSGEKLSGPDKWLSDFVNRRETFRVIPSLFAEYRILPWLTFRSTLGADYKGSEFVKFKSSRVSSTSGNIGAAAHTDNFRYNWDNIFLLNKRFGRHNVSGTIGMTASRVSSLTQNVQGYNIEQYKALEKTLNAAEDATFKYSESISSLLSFLARAVYSYDDRYVLTATLRYDGSSKFQGANKWGFFPSCAFAWRFSQEPWFKSKVVSLGKLRLGWGQVGNQAISNYQTFTNYATKKVGNHISDAGYAVGMYVSNLANPDLKWETTEQMNVGLDLGFWKGRLAVSADAYYKNTYDLLQLKNIPRSTGFETVWMNNGSIINYGFEFTIDATPIKTKIWELNIGGNISLNRNKIASIGDGGEYGKLLVAPGRTVMTNYFYGNSLTNATGGGANINIFAEGYPMGMFYGYKTAGIIQSGDYAGGINYVDSNEDGKIDINDRVIIGNPNPDFTYGFNIALSYKRWTLTADFVGSYGNEIFNMNNLREYDTSTYTYNVRKVAVTQAWSETNKSGKFPALGSLTSTDRERFSDRCIEDGSYLRLANLSLSYSFPFDRKNFVKGLDVGLNVSNVFILTKYSGWDPDVSSYGSSVMIMGVDSNSYPVSRIFSIDFKFLF